MFQTIIDIIHKYDTIILHRHSNPDGDALGSQIGLKHILKANFPQKQIYAVGDPAGVYTFMDDCIMDNIPDITYKNALAIVLDCGAKHLINDERFSLAHYTIRFDHHLFRDPIADYEIVDTSYESCCGLITDFAMQSNLLVPPIAAKALYTGMVTDSGRFRYDSTTTRTFRLASYLMEQSININDIYTKLYAEDFEEKKLKAQFLLKIKFTQHKVAYIYTTLEELKELNKDTFSISRGLVNIMADIKGSDIWVNFTETEDGILCELRSSHYNINPIAVKYGGGGHAKASGATVSSKEEAMLLLADLDQLTSNQRKD